MDQISFGTDGWRATLDTFTDRRVRIVGQAVADTLAETEADAAAADTTDRPVLVGYDARPTSEGFAESLAEPGLRALDELTSDPLDDVEAILVGEGDEAVRGDVVGG